MYIETMSETRFRNLTGATGFTGAHSPTIDRYFNAGHLLPRLLGKGLVCSKICIRAMIITVTFVCVLEARGQTQ